MTEFHQEVEPAEVGNRRELPERKDGHLQQTNVDPAGPLFGKLGQGSPLTVMVPFSSCRLWRRTCLMSLHAGQTVWLPAAGTPPGT